MKIDNIEFHGFKAKNRFAKVEFSSDNVTVIYGDNGCGKTTFLKAINSFLSQDSDELSSIGISKIVCNIIDEEQSKFICVELKDEGYDWAEFEASSLVNSRSLSLGVERGVSTQSLKIEPEVLMHFFAHPKRQNELFADHRGMALSKRSMYELSEELSVFLRRRNAARFRNKRSEIDFDEKHLYLQSIKIENIEELLLQRYRVARFTATRKIQSALFDTLSVAIDVENSAEDRANTDKSLLGKRIVESKDRIIEALDDGDDNKFKNRIVDILGRIDQQGELDKILEHSLLSELFQNMIDELEVEKLILSSINLLVDKFNTYLINDKKLVVNGREVFVEIGDERHSVNELSSGERHILTFLALVLFEGQGRNFLVIDEPEISLNIKWQRELMALFSVLLPSTQIIVASHSPALAKRNPNFLSELKVWRD
jgi:predicted ATPase